MIYALRYADREQEFIQPEQNAFQEMQIPCLNSAFQNISKEPLEVFTSDTEGGLVFPEFYYDDFVPLFQEHIYQAMLEHSVHNLFTRKIIVTDRIQNLSVPYLMGLPPRIPVCAPDGLPDESRAGSYQMFRSEHLSDSRIYIRNSLRELFETLHPSGMELDII